jgi:hypothetical protein
MDAEGSAGGGWDRLVPVRISTSIQNTGSEKLRGAWHHWLMLLENWHGLKRREIYAHVGAIAQLLPAEDSRNE